MTQQKSMEKVTEIAMKIAKPLAKFGEIKGVKAVSMGLVSCMPITIIGSIFVLLNVFSTVGGMGIPGVAFLPFFTGIADKFAIVNNLTLNFLGFWAALTIAQNYAELNNYEPKTAGMIGVLTFLLISTDGPTKGLLDSSYFGARGLFIAMICSVWFVKLYMYLDRKNIKIKMPDSVPPYIASTFGSLVPIIIITVLCFLIREILGINLANIVNNLLAPITVNAENPFVYSIIGALGTLLWFCGLHGAALLGPITQPLTTLYMAENVAAKAAGASVLPHVWCGYALGAVGFAGSFYVLTLLLCRSRLENLRVIGKAAAVPIIFNIQEPLVFGVPLVFNGYLLVPWILSNFVNGLIAWFMTSTNFLGKAFADVSWACPSFLALPFSTGDLKTLILIPISFAIAYVIWKPFFVAFENSEEARMKAEAVAAQEEKSE